MAQVVERWNPYAKVRHDLFDCIDIVACVPPPTHSLESGRIVGIQCTSNSNVSSRVAKIMASVKMRTWMRAGGLLEVWGWAKKGAHGKRTTWTLRVVRIERTLDFADLVQPAGA